MTRLPGHPLSPQVLLPFHRDEVLSIVEAALQAGKSARTIREWCMRFDIGRRVAGRWAVSKVALQMLLDGDRDALHRYLAGDRTSPIVTAYYQRLEVPVPRTRGPQPASGSASENNDYRKQSCGGNRASLQNEPNYSLARQRGEVAK